MANVKDDEFETLDFADESEYIEVEDDSSTATGITVQAWIDGGSSDPEATVSLNRSEHEGLYELVIAIRPANKVQTRGPMARLLLDVDSLHALLATL